ncbi:MAG TPA: amidohydrolase family protein [Terracidiphilus sp.]|nr:amidohydrolase family protein [Terracidiphilus sp.]
MRIDAHQHFWKYSAAEYGWITEEMGALKRDFLPRDLQPLLSANGFGGSIAVQACQSVRETEWLLALAAENPFIRGVVGWVDLCSKDVSQDLERLARHRKLVGVRHVVQGEPDDAFMLRADFRKGIGLLGEFGLRYDLLLYPRHLPVAQKLVAEFPKQTFVLDHISKPLIADGVLEPWAKDITELAKYPNVWCKVSGMVTEARWKMWEPADFRPYLDVVFAAFGPERLMIGSDWPVCSISADYGATIGLVSNYTRDLHADDRERILGGNCARAYGLTTQMASRPF